MISGRGKDFEKKFAENWKKTFSSSFIYRIPDQQSFYYGTSQNLCDYICFVYPMLFLIETKSHKGNTFPWTALSQYDKLIEKVGIKGIRTGVVLWMIDHDIVVYLPIKTVYKMKKAGLKSFNVKMLEDEKWKDLIHIIPSVKKRVFMDSDYSILMTLEEGE